jgi:hypothetical protein
MYSYAYLIPIEFVFLRVIQRLLFDLNYNESKPVVLYIIHYIVFNLHWIEWWTTVRQRFSMNACVDIHVERSRVFFNNHPLEQLITNSDEDESGETVGTKRYRAQ